MGKIEIFWGKCDDCGHEFDVYTGRFLDYGLRLLKSEFQKHLAKVNVLEDSVFIDIKNIVKKKFGNPKSISSQIAELLDAIFSRICDPAPDGTLYDMTGKLKCPVCHSDDISFGPKESENKIEMEIPEVTHKKWDLLDHNQKQMIVEELLKMVEKK